MEGTVCSTKTMMHLLYTIVPQNFFLLQKSVGIQVHFFCKHHKTVPSEDRSFTGGEGQKKVKFLV